MRVCVFLSFYVPSTAQGHLRERGKRERGRDRQTDGQTDRQRISLINLSPDAEQHIRSLLIFCGLPTLGHEPVVYL